MVLAPRLRISVDVGCSQHSVAVGLSNGELLEFFGENLTGVNGGAGHGHT